MLAFDLIERSLRLIGVLSTGEMPSADEASDALETLQDLLDGWQAESLQVFTVVRQLLDSRGLPFTLTPGQQVYTLGAGGNFNFPRPTRLDRAGLISTSNPAQPLELPLEMLTMEQWQAVPVKNIQSTIPQKLWNDKNFPLMNLSFWCVPSVAQQIALYIWQPLATFPDLNVTDVELPPAYARALRFNLAVDLAAEYGGTADPAAVALVAQKADEAKNLLKSFNLRVPVLGCDPALAVPSSRGTYNWLTDQIAGRQN